MFISSYLSKEYMSDGDAELPPSEIEGSFEYRIAQEKEANLQTYNDCKDGLEQNHIGKYYAICMGEVFIGDSIKDVHEKSQEAYPDRMHRFIGQIIEGFAKEKAPKKIILRHRVRRSE